MVGEGGSLDCIDAQININLCSQEWKKVLRPNPVAELEGDVFRIVNGFWDGGKVARSSRANNVPEFVRCLTLLVSALKTLPSTPKVVPLMFAMEGEIAELQERHMGSAFEESVKAFKASPASGTTIRETACSAAAVGHLVQSSPTIESMMLDVLGVSSELMKDAPGDDLIGELVNLWKCVTSLDSLKTATDKTHSFQVCKWLLTVSESHLAVTQAFDGYKSLAEDGDFRKLRSVVSHLVAMIKRTRRTAHILSYLVILRANIGCDARAVWDIRGPIHFQQQFTKPLSRPLTRPVQDAKRHARNVPDDLLIGNAFLVHNNFLEILNMHKKCE